MLAYTQGEHPIHAQILAIMNTTLLIKPLLFGLLLSSISYSATATDIYRYIDPKGRLLLTDTPKHKGYIRLEKTARGWEVARLISAKSNRRRYTETITKMAETHNISEHLIHAIISVESAYNPQALSRAGAQGLMQLMPATARRFGVRDSFDPVDNIRGGTTYFKELLRMFNDDLQLSLAAYNAGENAVKRYNNRIPPFKETQDYVKKVMLRYDQYRIASR
ncbi:MAG: soluble lytic murein transglycosylase-like protein [Candidatus Endobugula sp.]|jgi:soluble lytic murein transglycosylase-like protein